MNISPQAQIARILTGYWTSQMVYVAAKLDLPGLLKSGPRSSDDLARATGTHPRSLYRLLRGLASLGIFAEGAAKQFSMTPLAEALLDDYPGSQRAMAIMSGEEHYVSWSELL